MSLGIVRPFYHRSTIAISLGRPCGGKSNRFFLNSERSICRSLSLSTKCSLIVFWKASVERSSLRAVRRYASLTKSGHRTSWDEAADAYFSDVNEKGTSAGKSSAPDGERGGRSVDRTSRGDPKDGNIGSNSSGSDSWERSEKEAFGRRSRAASNGPRMEGARWKDAHSSGRDLNGFSEGAKSWASTKDFGSNSYGYGGGDRSGRVTQWQKSASVDSRERRDLGDRKSGYGGERSGAGQSQKPARTFGSKRDGGPYNGRSGSDNRRKGKNPESFRNEEYKREIPDDRVGLENEWRWQSREYSPPLQVEGQAVYGVAPIVSALNVSRRELFCLYMQENLRQNIDKGKRKDKTAVSFIEKTVKSLGVTVKEASKHDLNLMVDNRPHQGLVLDASPLELVELDMLDVPLYQDSSKPPVWVALDEVTDPQNFGAILRSAYFLGAEGVVVCAKNSAPLSGVVSKASSGAMEVMEVHSCRNMMKFLNRCKENGWRVVGASAHPASVPVRALPHGVATILVLGNEGRGLRTNVKRACDLLVSIGGISNSSYQQSNNFANFVTKDLDEDPTLDVEDDVEDEGVRIGAGLNFEKDVEDDGVRRGTELGLISGPLAVDSLNVSVAAGIMLYELLGSSPMGTDGGTSPEAS